MGQKPTSNDQEKILSTSLQDYLKTSRLQELEVKQKLTQKEKSAKVSTGKSVSFHNLNHCSDEESMPTLHNKVRKRIHSSDEESVASLLDRVLLKRQKI